MEKCWWVLGSIYQERFLCRVYGILSNEDLKWCRLVCRQWRDASRHGIHSLSPKSLDQRQVTKKFPKLRQLDLTRVEDLSCRVLASLCELKQLTAVRLPPVSDGWLLKLCTLTQLQSLDLSSATTLTDCGMTAVCQILTELRCLNVKRCISLTDLAFAKIACLGHLVYLNISSLPEVTQLTLEGLHKVESLQTLKVKNLSGLSNEGMEFIRRTRSLTVLDISDWRGHHQLTDGCLVVITYQQMVDGYLGCSQSQGIAWSLPKLKKLMMTVTESISLQGLLEMIYFHRLEELHLTNVGQMHSMEVCHVLGETPLLGIVELEGCGSMEAHSIDRLVRNKCLQTIRISSGREECMPYITDAAVCLLESLPTLECLVIRGFARITGRTFNRLSGLTTLSIVGCPDVTDSHFTGLSSLVQLTSLEHRYCDGLTDAAFNAIAELKNLESLTVACNRYVNGVELSVLSRLKALTSLAVCHCESVTDEAIFGVRILKSLRSLDLSGCKKITDIGMHYLTSGTLLDLACLRVENCDVRHTNIDVLKRFFPKLRRLNTRRSSPTLPDRTCY